MRRSPLVNYQFKGSSLAIRGTPHGRQVKFQSKRLPSAGRMPSQSSGGMPATRIFERNRPRNFRAPRASQTRRVGCPTIDTRRWHGSGEARAAMSVGVRWQGSEERAGHRASTGGKRGTGTIPLASKKSWVASFCLALPLSASVQRSIGRTGRDGPVSPLIPASC